MINCRVSKSLKRLLYEVKIEFLRRDKKPPSETLITEVIASLVKKEDVLSHESIKI